MKFGDAEMKSLSSFVKEAIYQNLPFSKTVDLNGPFLMINLNSVGLMNLLITFIAFGSISLETSFIITSIIVLVLIILLVYIFFVNRINMFKYTRIHSSNITVFLMESYNLNDLNEVKKYDK